MALHGYIVRLRKILPAGQTVTDDAGYRIAAGPGELDVEPFEALLANAHEMGRSGDRAHARELLDAALNLWRGPALVDVRDTEIARREAARLEELGLHAREESIEAALGLGLHRDILEPAARSPASTRPVSGSPASSCSRCTAAAARPTRWTPTVPCGADP